MKRFAETLWDLLGWSDRDRDRDERVGAQRDGEGDARAVVVEAKPRVVVVAKPQAALPAKPQAAGRAPSMQERYDALVEEMKRTYDIRIRKWRSSTSGVAWEVHYRSGRISRLVESPYPRGPMSCAVFLHEVGHHAIGFRTYRPRCLEEYHAWKWSIEAMRERGLNVTPAVEKRMHDALRYAVRKARRRGIKRLPVELAPFL